MLKFEVRRFGFVFILQLQMINIVAPTILPSLVVPSIYCHTSPNMVVVHYYYLLSSVSDDDSEVLFLCMELDYS